jgi:hypothetical protein
LTPHCDVERAGSIALYFYGELAATERAELRRHLHTCATCHHALDDLAAISAALATTRPAIAPSGDDWTAFMSRLHARVEAEPGRVVPSGRLRFRWRSSGAPKPLAAGLALAAALVLATLMVVWVLDGVVRHPAAGVLTEAPPPAAVVPVAPAPDPVLAAISGQHFARSKVVVLGLATRDTAAGSDADWRFERDLASSLLSDTTLYRMAAEDRGMTSLAGVMRDLELVLLEASMTPEPDRSGLEQVQRLIRRRDLVTKMNTAYADLFD